MTNGWSVDLPVELNRRIEDGSLVLWRPGLTFWVAIWNTNGESQEDRINQIIESADPNRTAQQIDREKNLTRLTYELVEADSERKQSVYGSISGHVLGSTESVQISAYFDTSKDRSLGYQIIHSVRNIA